MKKRILLLSSSPRRHGNSDRLCDEFLATPVYFYTMSAQMKTLIDRCCARYTEMTGKEFYFIVAAADDSKAAMERTIDGFRGFLDCLDDSRECGTIYGVGAWKIGEIEGSPAMKQAYDAGLNC